MISNSGLRAEFGRKQPFYDKVLNHRIVGKPRLLLQTLQIGDRRMSLPILIVEKDCREIRTRAIP